MPIYEVTVSGVEKPRMVKAKTAGGARVHVADAKAISAERMADLLAEGVKLETAGAAAEAKAQEEGDSTVNGTAGDDTVKGGDNE